MGNLGVFVSDKGQILDVGLQDLRWASRHERSSATPADQPGFVWFRLEAHGAHLRLPYGHFPHACFERVVKLLFTYGIARLVIEHEHPGEPVEVVHNIHDIIARLDFLRSVTPGECPRASYILARLDCGRLRHPKRGRLAAIYAAWAQSHGRLSRDNEPLKRVGGFGGGHMLVSIKRDQVIIQDWPRTIAPYSAEVMGSLVGRDMTDQPDKQFGEWSAASYRRNADRPEAWLDLIEAVVRPADAPPMILRYERLMLPWRASSGETWVSGTQLVRSRRLLRSA